MNELKAIAKLSKPLAKLIDSIGAGIGKVYAPTHTRRMADAVAYKSIVRAKTDVAVKDIRHRAQSRINFIEERRQRNIEDIVESTERYLPERVAETPVDADWIAAFFNSCHDVANKDMQIIWARLLAGEVTKPGTYSHRTLFAVRQINSEDARTLSGYCSFICRRDDGRMCRPALYPLNEYVHQKGLAMDDIRHLEDIGLVYSADLNFNAIAASSRPHRKLSLQYCEKTLEVSLFTRVVGIPFDGLTHIGQELFPIAGAQEDPDYFQTMVTHLKGSGNIFVK